MIDTTFSNIEDYIKKTVDFGFYTIQLSSGKFICRHKELKLSDITVGERYVSTSMLYCRISKQEYFYIAIPTGGVGGILVDGQKVELNHFIMLNLEQKALIRVPDNSNVIYIIIPGVKLFKYFNLEYIEQLKRITNPISIGKKEYLESEKSIKKLCALIKDSLKYNPLLNIQEKLDIETIVMELLCKLLIQSSPSTRKKHISHKRRLAIVYRALHYIDKNCATNIYSPELAKVSFCSLRNLEYSFKSILNLTPKQYLIKSRLQLIHLALKSDEKLLISGVIQNFGITNEGRFAQLYFKFYNEYPHQTREKQLNYKV